MAGTRAQDLGIEMFVGVPVVEVLRVSSVDLQGRVAVDTVQLVGAVGSGGDAVVASW